MLEWGSEEEAGEFYLIDVCLKHYDKKLYAL